jgi:hypothetical protein
MALGDHHVIAQKDGSWDVARLVQLYVPLGIMARDVTERWMKESAETRPLTDGSGEVLRA